MIQSCEAPSGSYIALRINFSDPQGIKLREFQKCRLQRQYTGKSGVGFVYEGVWKQNWAGYHGIVGQYWSFMLWPYCIMELLPKISENHKAILKKKKSTIQSKTLDKAFFFKQMRKGAML